MKNRTSDLTCRCLRAGESRVRSDRGLTLLEVLVTVALLAALMAVTLPLVLSQTTRLTYDEVLNQIDRRAAVVREDAQRRSEPVWLEARLIESEGVWALGTRSMRTDPETGLMDFEELSAALLGEMETAMAEDIMDQPPMFEDELETMSGFEVLMRLPHGYKFLRELPEELREIREQGAEVDSDNALIEAASLIEDEEFLDSEAEVGFMEAEATRLLFAVFLPDGTLIGPEKLYLQAPERRLATIEMSRWLGTVKCETLTLGTLMEPGRVEDSGEDEPARDEPSDPGEPTGREPAVPSGTDGGVGS